VRQDGAFYSGVQVRQVGNGNRANVTQQDTMFTEEQSIFQTGNNNFASAYESGRENASYIEQNGNNNRATVSQIGEGLVSSVVQNGSNNTAAIVQH
jgi:hypothetical protein